MSRYLNPQNDLVFKKIFSHGDLLKSFLNAVLPLPVDGLIDSLEYLPSEQAPQIPTFKNTIVDVKCRDKKGRVFIVEMQIQWVPSFMQRMLFGASRAYINQLEKGENYESLNPVYALGLLVSNFDNESPDWYHHYKMVNVQKPERELTGLQLVFVELLKFRPTKFYEKKLQVLWLRFMSEINEKSRAIDPEFLTVPEIKEALDLSEEAGYTPAELEAYNKYWDWVSTEKTLTQGFYAKGLKKGMEKGVEKGRQEEKIDIAKKLFETGMSLEQISQITQLSVEVLRLELSQRV